jgi:hypothetical protein
MSCLVVELPRGHRVKVATNPNMTLLAVKDAACAKRKLDPQAFALHHKGRRLDLSLTIRFAGIPNNGTLELVEVPEEERAAAGQQEVTIALQLPSGERLVAAFSPSATLAEVVARWAGQVAGPAQGEETVVVYTRQEVVGDAALATTTLRGLGLVQGNGLFRLMYKQPEALRGQAGVYDMKVAERDETPERLHRPMRVEAATLPKEERVEEMGTEALVEGGGGAGQGRDVEMEETEVRDPAVEEPGRVATPGCPASTSTRQGPARPQPVRRPLGPTGALVYREEGEGPVNETDIGDDFFDLSLNEVNSTPAHSVHRPPRR